MRFRPASGQQKSAGRPARHFHIQHNPPLAPTTNGGPTPGSDFPILVPLAFFDYRRIPVMLGEKSGNSGKLGDWPILKTSVTRRSLLWSLPKRSRVAHHSEECFVFGFFRSSRGFNVWTGFLAALRLGLNLGPLSFLAHWTHSLPVSIMYNRFSKLSSVFVQFYIFHKCKSIAVSKVHNCVAPQSTRCAAGAKRQPGRGPRPGEMPVSGPRGFPRCARSRCTGGAPPRAGHTPPPGAGR